MAADGDAHRLSPDEFREVMGHFASGVTIVTTESDGGTYGTTTSAVASLSLEPPMVLVCMNQASSTGQAIGRSGAFAINILHVDQHDLARRFATKDPDKFAGVELAPGAFGQPLLADALATIECGVTETMTGGTHTVYIAEVRSAVSYEGAPLAYFRGEFGRLEPFAGSPQPPT